MIRNTRHGIGNLNAGYRSSTEMEVKQQKIPAAVAAGIAF